jgi:hypothetical protein
MSLIIRGNAGEFVIKNESSILEIKIDELGNQTGESIVHVITDSIENQEDRALVNQKIEEYKSL